MAEDADQRTASSARRAGRPTSAETGRLNEKILEAAFAVFAREGFGGATIEQIAQESGTTRRSVLNRFPDKRALLIAIIQMRRRRLERALEPPEVLALIKPMEALKEGCWLMLENAVSDDNREFVRLCFGHAARFPEISAIMMEWNDRWVEDLKTIVERAQGKGDFVGRDPEMVAHGLIGAFVSNPGNRAALGDEQFRDPARLRRYFDGMWSFVRDLT